MGAWSYVLLGLYKRDQNRSKTKPLNEIIEELFKRDEQLRKIVRKWNNEIFSNRENIQELRNKIKELMK